MDDNVILCTGNANGGNACKLFTVKRKFLEKFLRIPNSKSSIFDEFMDSYGQEESLDIYQEAAKNGMILSEMTIK